MGPRDVKESPLKEVLVRRYAPYNREQTGIRGGLLRFGLSGDCLVFSCVCCMLTQSPLNFDSGIKRPL